MKKGKLSAVYSLSITVGETDFIYIGSTSDLYRRMRENNTKLENGVHHCQVIQDLYNKGYRHQIELLEVQDDYKKLISTENEYIDYFRRLEGVVVTNVRPAVMVSKRVYLSYAKVIEIKHMLAKGIEPLKISKALGVRPAQVYRIKSGERWASVQI
jgi:hypothetical protein